MVGTRIERQRTTALGIAGVIALGVGVALAVAKGPVYILIPFSPVLVLLVLLHPTARLAFVVFGALFTLQSSQALSPLKLAYLLGMFLALAAGLMNLRKHPAAYNNALIGCSAVIYGLVGVSFLVALTHGTDAITWLRDAASYLLIGAVPILMADTSSVPRRTIIAMFIAAGLLAAISFGLLWAGPTHRHLLDLPLDRLVYPSFLFAGALFAFATLRALIGGKGRAAWLGLASFIFAILLITGTRTTLLLLVIPAVFLVSKRFEAGRLRRVLVLAAGVGVVLVTAWYLLQFSSANTSTLVSRFSSFDQLINDPTSDLSFQDRLGQTGAAWDAFLSSPIFGVGLGHAFTWTSYFGRVVTDVFTIDTGLSFLAKFGLLGLLVLVMVVRLMRRATRLARISYPQMALVLTSYLVLLLCYLFFGNPLEEKGFGLGLLFLNTLLLGAGDKHQQP